jgi:hypothetical protein
MSVLDWILIGLFLASVSGCAASGLVGTFSVVAGAVLSYLFVVPLLTEPLAGVIVGFNDNLGQARFIALLIILTLGAIVGKIAGKILSLPVMILPGLNLLNTAGGALAGCILGLVIMGATLVGARLVAPVWTLDQLATGSFITSFLADNIGKLALLIAPNELKQIF